MKLSTLEIFADALKAKFALPGGASPEDQLKPLVADLFVAAGAAYGLTIETRTETHLSEHKVRPDIAIYVGGLICGYIELKAPGLGADAPRLPSVWPGLGQILAKKQGRAEAPGLSENFSLSESWQPLF